MRFGDHCIIVKVNRVILLYEMGVGHVMLLKTLRNLKAHHLGFGKLVCNNGDMGPTKIVQMINLD